MDRRRAIGPGWLLPIVVVAACRGDAKREREVKSHAARSNLEKIYDGAASYYASVARGCQDPAARCAERGEPRFPAPSVGPTPKLGACCAGGGDCDVDPSLWQAEPWRSLGFAVDRRQQYSYAYAVAADGGSFTARAIGDLDCDGTYATFTVSGTRSVADGEPHPIVVERTNELE